jgi:hypothetical protein
MIKTIRLTALSVLFTMTASACGDEAMGPEDEEMGWGTQEQQALITALASSGALAASPVAGFAAMVVGALDDVGSISTHETAALSQSIESDIELALSAAMSSTYDGAVGVQVGFDIDGTLGWFVGVIGWNGLSNGGSAVTDLVGVYHFDTGSDEPPATHSATIGLDGLQQSPPLSQTNHHFSTASYWDGTNSYWGTSGSFDISASSFSGTNDCSQTSFSCSYSTGNMSGAFEFDAMALNSDMSWTQVPVTFSNLRSVKLMISPGL